MHYKRENINTKKSTDENLSIIGDDKTLDEHKIKEGNLFLN